MSLTSPEIAVIVWEGLRALDSLSMDRSPLAELGRRRRVSAQPWSQLPDWIQDEVVDAVEMYRQGASAEEAYTARRDAALDAGMQLEGDGGPWESLPEHVRARGERMAAIARALN